MAKELKNFLGVTLHDRALKRSIEAYFLGRPKVVDIGCGTKPYRHLLAPHCSEHVGVDHEESFHDRSRVDRTGTAYAIPATDGEFDAALCTSVLEHLEEPELALRECCRVLKPGGLAIYTAPFIWNVHEAPRDFYRYSRYGLRHLFEKTGFEILTLEALFGYWLTAGQLFVNYIYRFHRGPLRFIPIVPLLGILVQVAAYALERLDSPDDWAAVHLVVARKR